MGGFPDGASENRTWRASSEYGRVAESTPNFAMKRASDRNEIYPVFRELFRKEGN